MDPARAEEVRFSVPYVTIEGVYVVPGASDFSDSSAVDAPGVRVGVKEGSAYDLFLSRSLQHATVVRGVDGVVVFAELDLEVGAGIRQPMTSFVSSAPTHRLLEPAFMQIHQAVGIPADRADATAAWVDDTVRELLASGFVRERLAAHGQDPDLAAAITPSG